MILFSEPKLRVAPRAPGERTVRTKTPQQRLETMLKTMLWQVGQQHPGLSSEETRYLLGAALRRNRATLVADAISGQ